MKLNFSKISILAAAIFIFGCHKTEEPPVENPEYQAGGATTVFDFFSDAFEQPAANLSADEIARHLDGDVAFGSIFVTAPAQINSGLGPIFNQNSCESCHGKNGRSAFPENLAADPGGLLFRVSLPGSGTHGEPVALPGFGGQLQTKAVWGTAPEVKVDVVWQEEIRQFVDGKTASLRRPTFSFSNSYIPFPAGAMVSPRLAPPVFGLGLLENIPAKNLLAAADPNDADGDGISGKANQVWDVLKNEMAVGRFGWKAGQPNVLQQSAAAYLNDMGITNPIFKNEHSAGQPQNDTLADDPEIDLPTLELAAFYSQSLGVPAPRDLENVDVAAGKILFEKTGCAKCHTPKQQTEAAEFSFLENQTFYPYTDLLLHDMGENLADHRPEFLADGKEWRTPPLWGIGKGKLVNGHTDFLHDGRARNLSEAILWHGGEADAARSNFEKLSEKKRGQLIRFLEAL